LSPSPSVRSSFARSRINESVGDMGELMESNRDVAVRGVID